MIVGDISKIAIESEITVAFSELHKIALGFFILHVANKSYGVRATEASLLACSLQTVRQRIANRGDHETFLAAIDDPGAIVEAVLSCLYSLARQDDIFFGFSCEDFRTHIYTKNLIWAPDGDEAFDDGSFVLQFDIGDKIRLIGFRQGDTPNDLPFDIVDITIGAQEYYAVLEDWVLHFEIERGKLLDRILH
jgi:hypothetical protein